MKPFNLEAALRGEPVCDKTGRVALAIRHIPQADKNCRVIVVWDMDEWPEHYTDDGFYVSGEADPILFMAPRKRKGWLHLMRDGSGGMYACCTLDENEMSSTQSSDEHVATVPVEWEE